MACFNGAGRAFINLAPKARYVILCSRNTGVGSELTLAKADRYITSVRHSFLSAGSSSPTTPLQGSRGLSSYLLRLPKEIACTQSLLPMYSSTAAARLVSQLSTSAGTTLVDLQDLSSLKPR